MYVIFMTHTAYDMYLEDKLLDDSLKKVELGGGW
jgi:hypothetical protein